MHRLNKYKKLKLSKMAVIFIAIFFMFIGVGYSYLKQSLEISGKSTIINTKENNYKSGFSVYSFKVIDSYNIEGTTNGKIYKIELEVVNMDSDINGWNISFDVPKSLNSELTKNLDGQNIESYQNGRITLKSTDENSYIAKGSNIVLNINLAFNEEVQFNINNLTLNGLLATIEK